MLQLLSIGNKYYYLTLLSSDVSKSESIEYWISIFKTRYFEHHYILTVTLKKY